MDFSSLLDSAANNAKSVSKTLNTIESQVDKERKEKLKKLELERQRKHHEAKRKRKELEEAKQQKEEEERRKFTIPKKKNDSITVDKAGIEAYKAKKEQEARDKLKKQMAEKEKLIQLRLQNFGGKANKKIGKHFGINPIDLQIRYGNDHEHVERLQKLKLREEEEMDERAAQLRTGVYRAKEMQRKTEEKLRQSGTPKQPHRVSTSKSNSLAGLSSRHTSTRDHFSPPPEPKKTSKPAYKPPEKKRPAPPPVDFSSLMRAAEDLSQGKNVKLSSLAPPRPEVNESRRETSSMSFNKRSTEKSRHEKDRDASKISSRPSSHSSQPVRPVKPSVAPSKPAAQLKHDKNDNKASSNEKAIRKDGRFVKKPTPPPIIPAAVPGKKYLPGDVRYQTAMGSSSASTSKQMAPNRPSSSSQHSQSSRNEISRGSASVQRSKDRPMSSRDIQRTEKPREPSRAQLERERDQERDRQRDRRRMEEKQREKERIRRMNEKRRYEEQLPLRERERMRDMKRKYGDHHDEDDEDDDDDYDSDMDDFIDDTGLDEDDLYRQEFEDTLKQVNPKYDKKLWKQRERQIDDRHMEARYGDIQMEEKRSARLGLLEDLKQAQNGKSIALG